MIKCVNGLEPFQQGRISVDGVSVGDPKTNLPKLRARIGMVFQHFELFPHLSVMRNLTLPQIKVLHRNASEAEEKGARLLDRVGLAAHAGKFPGQLSGGQQQMLAIGRGLMAQPRLLCLDEPSLGLSPLMMEAVAEKIGEIRRSGRLSLLVVEQSASMALALCDRVYLMHTGSIVHHANAADLSLELIREGYFGEQRTS